ncbi:Phytochrome-like protein cph2 [compost metagenome]
MIDVDYFKAYNDTYGHVAGDEVLRRVAGVIRDNCARPADLPARFGGEEFSMILPATSAGGARLLAEKVRRAIESLQIPHSGSPTSDMVTISIGGAVIVPDENGDASRLVQAADAGLYQAKRNGRNQVVMV